MTLLDFLKFIVFRNDKFTEPDPIGPSTTQTKRRGMSEGCMVKSSGIADGGVGSEVVLSHEGFREQCR